MTQNAHHSYKSVRLWVVEMLVDDGRWEPTVGCGITRDQARNECIQWRSDNPADQFRVREYVPYATHHEDTNGR